MTTRNTNAHFDLAPQVGIERSTFNMDCNVHTSFDVGQLVPFYVLECLPGDTFQIQTSKVARLQTLIAPVMDNLYLDTYYFFVPNRLVWDDWQKFMGESEPDVWQSSYTNNYVIPQVEAPDDGWNVGTIADYMGIPTGIGDNDNDEIFRVNALPFRAYAKIWNDWFRDENLQFSVNVKKDYANIKGTNDNNSIYGVCTGGVPLNANKYHDYFTSCLKAPQKGPAIDFLYGMMPVRTYGADTVTGANRPALRIKNTDNSKVTSTQYVSVSATASGSVVNNLESSGVNAGSGTRKGLVPTNLYVDFADIMQDTTGGGNYSPLSNFTINALRQAFQLQRFLEKDARGGTRYIEMIKAHFGVNSPDARLQRSEYLGGNRIPLNIEQVVNTTTGNDGYMPGDVSGWSQTNDTSFDVEKSFTEHGFIIGLMCARYDHTYQQGLERFWSRRDRYDYYWPVLAHLGEQAVLHKEIRAIGQEAADEAVFGYQEAWAEYRYKPNYVTGSMRTQANKSLDIWHFADYYTAQPHLSDTWIQEDKNNVDRSLIVKSNVENQIFIDIFVKNKATRPMPLYSIPGYIDHF